MTSEITGAGGQTAGQIAWNLVLITSGSVLCALGINGILLPNKFVNGGVTGISLILNAVMPSLNVGIIYLVLNIPLFLLAYLSVGKRFFYYSLAGLFIFSGTLYILHIPITLEDKMLSALFAGILVGAGTGLILKSYGSAGGMDILSVMLLKRFSIKLGDTILVMNSIVLILVTFLFSLEAVLYTVIVLFVSSRIVDVVISGLSQRKAIFIISSKWREISKEILSDIRRGVTILKGEGGYSGQEEKILYTVITFRELGELKRLINRIDPEAFVVVSDTLEVMNYRIGNQPHW